MSSFTRPLPHGSVERGIARENESEGDIVYRSAIAQCVVDRQHSDQSVALIRCRDRCRRPGRARSPKDMLSDCCRREAPCRMIVHRNDERRHTSIRGMADADTKPPWPGGEHQVPLARGHALCRDLDACRQPELRRFDRIFENHNTGHMLRRPQSRALIRPGVGRAGESKDPIARPDPPSSDLGGLKPQRRAFRFPPIRADNRHFGAGTPVRNRQNHELHSGRRPRAIATTSDHPCAPCQYRGKTRAYRSRPSELVLAAMFAHCSPSTGMTSHLNLYKLDQVGPQARRRITV